jgi:hypothetical protein
VRNTLFPQIQGEDWPRAISVDQIRFWSLSKVIGGFWLSYAIPEQFIPLNWGHARYCAEVLWPDAMIRLPKMIATIQLVFIGF